MGKLYNPIIFSGDPMECLISKMEFRYAMIILRKQLHLTQKDVADVAKLSVQCISDIENDGNPTIKSIIKYLDALGYELAVQKKIN